MWTGNCIIVHNSNLIRTMASLFCAVNMFWVFREVKVKVYHRKYKNRNNVKLEVSDENYLLEWQLLTDSVTDPRAQKWSLAEGTANFGHRDSHYLITWLTVEHKENYLLIAWLILEHRNDHLLIPWLITEHSDNHLLTAWLILGQRHDHLLIDD
jgi:hypothetical protein